MNTFFYIVTLFFGCTVLCCEEGNRHRIKGTLCRYVECQNEMWVLATCHSNQSYYSKNDKCEKAKCLDYVTKCSENTFYGYYSDDRAYYECVKSRLVLKFCQKDEIFDTKRKSCRKILSYQTETNKDSDTYNSHVSGDKLNVKGNTENTCIEGKSRKKEGHCKEYYRCNDGKEIEDKCQECENYDEIEKKCRYVFITPCHSKTPDDATTISPPDPSSDPTSTIETNPNEEGTTQEDQTTPRSDHTEDTSEPTSPTGTYSTTSETEIPTKPTSSVTEHSHRSDDDKPTTPVSPNTETTPSDDTSPGNEDNQTELTQTTPLTSPTNPSPVYSTAEPSQQPECKESKQAVLSDCKYYLECQNDELVQRKCGWLQHFDSQSMQCAYIGYQCLGTNRTSSLTDYFSFT